MRDHLRSAHRVGFERRDDLIPPEGTTIFLALLAVYGRQHRATIGEVAAEARVSRGNAYRQLTLLWRAGLVGMGGAGMLRPLVRAVPLVVRPKR